jgi:hypothetical protein
MGLLKKSMFSIIVYVKLSMKNCIYIMLTLFLTLSLSSCAPREADFKSKVPVVDPIEGPIDDPMVSKTIGSTTGSTIGSSIGIPSEINLPVPFYPQAPDADWGMPWQEACEEAAITLAHAYATHKTLTKEQFKSTILELVDYENRTFGDYEHTTIEQTAQMVREYFKFTNLEILDNPSIESMKSALAKGNVIVAPFSGKDLKNPFYSNGGPLYHMMVIKGYDATHFITNDVGTRRGENFIYPYERIMDTMHDWNGEDIRQGAKRVIIMKPD